MPTAGAFAGSQLAATPVIADDGTQVYRLQFDSTGGNSSAVSTPVTGTFTGTGTSALFTAIPGFAVWVKLSGTFAGTVQVERCSTGLAASAQVLTVAGSAWAVFTAPVQEAVSSEDASGVAYRLNCTAYTSGTIAYQIGHK